MLAVSYRKWEVEGFKQSQRFFIVRCTRTNDDVHSQNIIDFIVVDFWKHDVFFQAHGEVATAIKALRVQAAKVTYAWKRNSNQTVHEFIHTLTAQGNFRTKRHVFTYLKTSN